MKKLHPYLQVCAGVFALSVLAVSAASAQIYAYDPFNTAAGTGALTGSASGTGWSSSWSNADPGGGNPTVDNDVVSPGATYGMLQTAGNQAQTEAAQGFGAGSLRTLTTPLNGNLWASVLIQGSAAGGSAFFGLTLLTNGGADPNNNGILALGQLYSQTTYGVFGDSNPVNSANGSVTSTVSSTSAAFLVFNINTTTGTGTFYVNPTGLGTGTAPTGADYTSAFTFNTFTNVSGVGLRGNTPTTYDEVRLGATWADVSPVAQAGVPEPSTYAMLALGGVAGAFVLRRRVARQA